MHTYVAYADSLDNVLFKINEKILNPIIELSFIVALVLFLYGLMQFIRNSNKDTERSIGRKHMMWGIVGFLIMFGVFAIINILVRTFGIGGVKVNNREQTFDPPPIQELKIPQ